VWFMPIWPGAVLMGKAVAQKVYTNGTCRTSKLPARITTYWSSHLNFTPRTTRSAVILAFVVLLLQATPLLYTRWVEDENWHGSVGYTLLTEGRLRNPVFPDADIESHVDTRPPGLPITLAATAAVLGPGPVQFRIPSVMAGLGLLLAIFLLGTELLGSGGGAIAALMAATDTFILLASRTTRQEIFVACFATLAVWLFFRARRTNSTLLMLFSGLAISLSANFHPNGLAIGFSLGLLMIAEFRFRILQAPRFWSFAVGSVLLILPFLLWVFLDPLRIRAFHELWGRSSQMTTALLVTYEKARYSDFLGMGSSRVPLPIHVPVRLHIVTAIIIAAIILWRSNRKLLVELIVLMIPSMLLWTTEVNGSSRYFAILAPYITLILVGGALEFGKNSAGRMRLAMAALIFIALTQIAGNAFFIWRWRGADYRSVSAGLRALVPPTAKPYGALTFWLTFYDRQYFSYNRVPLDYALAHGAEYLIINDRVMLYGTGYGDNFYEPLREQVNAFAHTHCQLVGVVPNSFYGDLEVYRVSDSSPGR